MIITTHDVVASEMIITTHSVLAYEMIIATHDVVASEVIITTRDVVASSIFVTTQNVVASAMIIMTMASSHRGRLVRSPWVCRCANATGALVVRSEESTAREVAAVRWAEPPWVRPHCSARSQAGAEPAIAAARRALASV